MGAPLAVVLVSGGMDSCVAAAIAAIDYRVALLHVNYGQRTLRRELRAFEEIADHYRAVSRLVISLDHLAVIGGSSLTDLSMPVSPASMSGHEIPTSYVPFRNASMLAAAVSWGEVLGAKGVVVGAVEEDSSGYPDCRKEFFDIFERLIRAGTRPSTDIRVLTPVIGMSKAEIVLRGMELKVPFHLTWSCYESEEMACGRCDSCALRLKGFRGAGVPDPIPYLQHPLVG